jgi:hypothetical protein
MPQPINLAQGFFNLGGGDPVSNLGRVVTGTIDPLSLFGTPTSSLTNSLSLNNPTLIAEAWSQLSPFIPLPNFNIDPRALAILARIPLPSNFVSRVPSTYGIIYPMPAIPVERPSIAPMPMREPEGASSSPLSQFISLVKENDFAFRSKYRVTLPNTVGITTTNQLDTGTLDTQKIGLLCENAEIPGLIYGTTPFKIYGPTFERPTMVSYGGENMTMMFLVDQNFSVRKYFESWLRLVVNPASYQFNYPESYLSSGIVVTQLKHRSAELQDSTRDVGVYSVRLLDAFPKAVIPMQVDGGNRDMHRLAVTFSYRQWVPVYEDSEPEFYYNSTDYVTTEGQTSPGETPET